nr:homocysteine-responsive endoplasmic reticulum-resident ubiquitin-like domain member 2 protein [Drosophila suzukii]
MEETAAASPAAATAAGCDAAAREKAPETGASPSGTSVRLLIKSSNQQYEDLNVDSDLSWTVQRLKKQLSMVYPGKPEIQDQKLIYSGKLLDDSQKISEVIRSYKDVYQQHHIFHLVCASKQILTPPAKTITVPPKAAVPPLQEVSGNANELRQRHPTHQQSAHQAATSPPVAGGIGLANPWAHFWQQNQAAAAAANASANPHAMFQQQALIYNAWIQQVYAQYMQQLALRSTLPGSNESVLPPLSQPLMPQVPLNAAQPVAGAAAPAAQAQPAPQVNGAPQNRNFPNIQEEPEMRDWLDSFFSFTRLAIFVTVLYFNSSPLRCLLVLLIAGAIYLYHIGVLRRRERNNNNINRNNNAGDAAAFAAVQQIQRMMDAAVERDNNDPQAANEPGAVPAAGPAAGQDAVDAPAAAAHVAPASAANPDAADVSAEAVAVEPPNANNSVISVVRTFVVTFFTSLLPEAPAL